MREVTLVARLPWRLPLDVGAAGRWLPRGRLIIADFAGFRDPFGPGEAAGKARVVPDFRVRVAGSRPMNRLRRAVLVPQVIHLMRTVVVEFFRSASGSCCHYDQGN